MANRDERLANIDAEFIYETDSAFLISDGDTEMWVPKSMCEWDGKTQFTMPEWKALELGLI